MKDFVLAILLFIGSSQIFAEKPPEIVAKVFKQKFPSAINIKWEKEGDNLWEAKFNLKKNRLSAVFTSDGHWIRSEMEISIVELREEVRKAIKQDYPSCEIISLRMIDAVGMGSWYWVDVKCGDKISHEVYDSNGYRIRI
jgi:hypothetical protein